MDSDDFLIENNGASSAVGWNYNDYWIDIEQHEEDSVLLNVKKVLDMKDMKLQSMRKKLQSQQSLISVLLETLSDREQTIRLLSEKIKQQSETTRNLSLLARTTEVNDLFFFMGTRDFSRDYVNPVLDNMLLLTASSTTGQVPIHFMIDKESKTSVSIKPYCTQDEPNSFILFDFRLFAVKPKKYFLRSANLLNWIIQGSNDNENWETLKEHKHAVWLIQQQSSCWPLHCTKFYRFLRILQNGVNQNENHCLCLYYCTFEAEVYLRVFFVL